MAAIRSLEAAALLQHSIPHGLLEPESFSTVRFPLGSFALRQQSSCPGLSRKGPLWDSCKKIPSRVFVGGVSATENEVSLDSDIGVSYEKLRDLLAASEWQLADEETRRLILVLAGESAVKRKYVFFSEVQFMPRTDLSTIDRLWRTYSNDKFGYSVQRKIWSRAGGDCTAFFKKVGWMRPLGSDSPQFTYRAFPTEFMWDTSSDTPEGHLPLTNALRGSQLLKSILAHPAFDFVDEDLKAPTTPDLFTGDSSRQPATPQKPATPLSVNYSF